MRRGSKAWVASMFGMWLWILRMLDVLVSVYQGVGIGFDCTICVGNFEGSHTVMKVRRETLMRGKSG